MMTNQKIAEVVKAAFEEGYDSYKTNCVSHTRFEDEWNESLSKILHDKLLELSE